eukprot:GFUD01008225.1.p1 GENE.GFUD01008225.1~~GFUD01008225.1.p1  ORF type:complete len:428 (-),score=113.48 GFUD01008225.1:127-1410(-)
MGNEASALQPHAALSKSDIENLQKTFPKNASKQLWSPWSEVFEPEQLDVLCRSMVVNKAGAISFQNYQQLAGNVAKGVLENKINFMLMIAKVPKENLTTDSLQTCIKVIAKAFSKSAKQNLSTSDEDCAKLAASLTHDLIFHNEKRKSTFQKQQEVVDIEIDDIEKLFMSNPLIENMITEVLNHCFQVTLKQQTLLPKLPPSEIKTSLSLLQVLFLNYQLPHEMRHIWRPLFSTDVHGESFSKFTGCIINQGPTVIVVWDDQENVFGGFATNSWTLGPKFCGKPETFLFHLHPKMNIYDSTPYNNNYQYFNLKQKTMPNGLGMGGQLEYFGFWIDSEFGIVKTSPTCSTYHSAQLGQLEGKIKKLEVFGVGDLKEEDIEAGRSILDMDPEAQAVLEMMGKTFHSKAIREVDEENDKKEKLESQLNNK